MNAKCNEEEDSNSSVTFAFGHTVGLGIQEYITHHSEDETIWKMFLMWEPDLLASNPKQNKSFWLAVAAVQRFISMCRHGFMEDWKLHQYNGKPATELSFIITFADGFTYKGYVDAVLQNEKTGEIMVLECKTTSATSISSASYKNSGQALGYSIVLDTLFPGISSYKVMYLIYKTKQAEFEVMHFEKSHLDRALWIRSLLLDIDTIKLYEDAAIYPMRGESCNAFFKECEYFNLCTLATAALTTQLTEEEAQEIARNHAEDFQITVSIADLIQTQLKKSESGEQHGAEESKLKLQHTT